MVAATTSLRVWAQLLACVSALASPQGRGRSGNSLRTARRQLQTRATATNITTDFEVSKPVTINSTGTVTTLTLMEHDFGNSYGSPFVGTFTPPDHGFNRVVLNFTAAVAGVQYDRLAFLYLGSTELWRTSTAEPTRAGVVWSHTKDASAYLALWTQPQTVIFELDNIVSSVYTGVYNTTLTATFFTDAAADAALPAAANAILPISALNGPTGAQSVFTIPSDNASVAYAIPGNVSRASVSIAANGQIDEEFWYTNVFSSQVDTFDTGIGTLLGGGPFREVQLRIDGLLAGVVWPFPVIFTGGVAPGLWRPVVGIQAFDLVESEIDITPFLPLLTDGAEHTFEINVFQLADSGNGSASLTEVESYWLATGKIFLFYGDEDYAASYNITHAAPTITGVSPTVEVASYIGTLPNGTNSSLWYSTTASRALTVSSPFGTWTQTLAFSNTGILTAGGLVQTNTQSTSGSQTATDAHAPAYDQTLSFEYPITVTTSYGIYAAGITIDASLSRGFQLADSGRPDFSVYSLAAGPARVDTRQDGTGHYSSVTNETYSFGTTAQSYSKTSGGTSYERTVRGVNGSVVSDSLGGGVDGGDGKTGFSVQDGAGASLYGAPKGMLGRGPGSLAKGL